MELQFSHVDVFTRRPYSGNSLAVFTDAGGLSERQMLLITQELRHFETIFLQPTARAGTVRARVFDLFEELPFAGHPLIGAAAVLHHESREPGARHWRFELAQRTVDLRTEPTPDGYFALLDQGQPEFAGVVHDSGWVAAAFGLDADDLRADLPVEVVSTGLKYLIVPVAAGGALARARIRRDITAALHSVGAQFAVLLDESQLEIRHWNNDGVIEDAATGSAAGAIGAYRLRHGLACADQTFLLSQGRFAGRPSTLRVQPEGSAERIHNVKVGGDVAMVGRGTLVARP
ncbi:MAG: PhzF family phenazine biosynthesis protein [Steroidobacteraceae bacterium]